MADIHAMELLVALQKVEARGAIETADRVLMLARQVWDYWLPTTTAQQRNITDGLKKRLTPYRGKSFAAIVEPVPFGELLRAIAAYKGGVFVRTALQLAPLLYQRPGNLRQMEWAELDLDAALWTIPSAMMKRTKLEKEQGEAPHGAPTHASRGAAALIGSPVLDTGARCRNSAQKVFPLAQEPRSTKFLTLWLLPVPVPLA